MSVKASKSPDYGSPEDLTAAFLAVRSVFGETVNSAYAHRCEDQVALGLCGSATMGLDPGRYPCCNPAEPFEPYCAGPCVPLVVFSDRR